MAYGDGIPRIMQRNWIDDETVFTSSHGGTVANLRDRDMFTFWTTSGANSDATTVTLTIEFNEGGSPVSRTIDSIIMLNHNLKNAQFEYWNGSAWTFWFAWTNMTDNYGMQPDMRVFLDEWPTIDEIAATKIRILIYGTQPANSEKYIGELYLSNTLITPMSMSSYEVKTRQKVKQVLLGDGGIQQVVQFWTPNRTQKYEAVIGFNQLSQAEWDTLRLLKETGVDFLWYPESQEAPREIYWVLWTNPLPKTYASMYKGAGINAKLELKEI